LALNVNINMDHQLTKLLHIL